MITREEIDTLVSGVRDAPDEIVGKLRKEGMMQQ